MCSAFLLRCMKFRVIIMTFSCVTVKSLDNHQQSVWFNDKCVVFLWYIYPNFLQLWNIVTIDGSSLGVSFFKNCYFKWPLHNVAVDWFCIRMLVSRQFDLAQAGAAGSGRQIHDYRWAREFHAGHFIHVVVLPGHCLPVNSIVCYREKQKLIEIIDSMICTAQGWELELKSSMQIFKEHLLLNCLIRTISKFFEWNLIWLSKFHRKKLVLFSISFDKGRNECHRINSKTLRSPRLIASVVRMWCSCWFLDN